MSPSYNKMSTSEFRYSIKNDKINEKMHFCGPFSLRLAHDLWQAPFALGVLAQMKEFIDLRNSGKFPDDSKYSFPFGDRQ